MSRPYIGPAVEVRLPPELIAAVEAIAAERKVSRGAVLREAVETYVRRKARKEKVCPTTS